MATGDLHVHTERPLSSIAFLRGRPGLPRYAIFAQPYSNPVIPRRLVYNRLQEAVRKNAERLYAVRWSRWIITKYPVRYMTLPRLINTA